jgi:LTXXQ motif family protein
MMLKRAWVLIIAAGLAIATESSSFAQFGGRGSGGLFGGSRNSRGNTQNNPNNLSRPVLDSYEQTEHRLALMEMDLQLTSQQKETWQAFANKVRAYASDISRERARAGIPPSEGTSIGGLQHIDLVTDGARIRLNELEDMRTAANALYATFSPDQKKIADARMISLITSPSGMTGGEGTGNFSGYRPTTRPQP